MPGTLQWEGADSSCLRGLEAKAALPATAGLELQGHVMPIPLPFCFSLFFPPFFKFPSLVFPALSFPKEDMDSPWGEALVPQAVGEACSQEYVWKSRVKF